MDQQRKDYKQKKNNKRNPSGEGKRSAKKIRKDVEKLGELVSLMQSSSGGSVNVSESNANIMGGHNSRQMKKDSENSKCQKYLA